MKIQSSNALALGVALVAITAIGTPATAQDAQQKARATQQEARDEAREARQETRDTTRRSGNAITDSWITMKVHSQFIPEDALEDSDIDVTTKRRVVTLTGIVASEAGKARAVEIARATDGVNSVTDRLRVVPGGDDADDRGTAGRTGAAAGAAGREAARDTREAGRSAGKAVSDGWVTSKIYSQYITEDALDNSDIDIDVKRGAVTLKGTVASREAASRAESIAQQTDGVRSVRNNLKVRASSR
jgi:hyperosmotically inducible periplasmic protein